MKVMKKQKREKSFLFPTISKLIQSTRNVIPTQRITRMTVKVLVLGSARVGKTSLIKAICNTQGSDEDKLRGDYQPTVHEVFEKEIIVEDVLVRFEFIDTAGQYSFPAMRQHYINQSHIYVLVFSKDNPDSYFEINRFRKEIESVRGKHSTELSILVAETKVDNFDPDEDAVSSSSNSILNWCYTYMKCSVKTGYNMHSIMEFFLKESALLCKNKEDLKQNNNEVSGRYLYEKGDSRCVRDDDVEKEHFRRISIRKWSKSTPNKKKSFPP